MRGLPRWSKIYKFIKARYAPRGAQVSFSAEGEDLVMQTILRKLGRQKLSYIDIGAHDPVFGNNTYLFYRSGGRGVLVEPNSLLCQKIRQKRPRDIVLNRGAGREDGQSDFYEFSRSTRSTFSKDQARSWEASSGEKAVVETKSITSLDSIMNEYFPNNIVDVVSIDAEGLDVEILSGFSFRKRPVLFCVESAAEARTLMERNGYELVAEIFYNSIFKDTTI